MENCKLAVFVILGLLLSCTSQVERSEEINGKAPLRKKDAASINTQMGVAYLKQGDRVRAKRKLLHAQQLAPKSPNANAAMGYYLEESGDVEKAFKYYKKALTYSNNSGSQLNNFGTFLCRQGKYRQAEQYFVKAVKDENYLNTAGAYENAGLCVEAIPDYATAKRYFKKALEQDPHRKTALHELLLMAKRQKHNKEALGYIEQSAGLVYNDQALLREAMDLAKLQKREKLVGFYEHRLLTLTQHATNKSGAKHDNNHG